MNKIISFIKSCTEKVSAKFKKATAAISVGLMTASMSMTRVFATDATPNTDATMDSLMGQVLKIIFTIFRYVGILLLVWSIAQIVMAFKNDDADSKQKGMMIAVISIVLITLSFVLKPILQTVGVSVPN